MADKNSKESKEDSRVRGVSTQNENIEEIANLDLSKSKVQPISDKVSTPADDILAELLGGSTKESKDAAPSAPVASESKPARLHEKTSRPLDLPWTAGGGFQIIDDAQKRVLAKELQKVEYLHRTFERDVTSNWQRHIDMWAFADLIKLYNEVCRAEYNRNIDFKSLGIRGKGHHLSDENIEKLAKCLVGMFGPNWVLTPESLEEFVNRLKVSAEDALDPEWREAGAG